jgi:Rps23 Pro-64 3,4-dihydroxylase Tpa1-like proline 4-hydroxylase
MDDLTEPSLQTTLRSPYLVIDDFLPLEIAHNLRRGIDHHFDKPETHRPATHQIWNYWFVPKQYMYLRTNPEKIIEREHVDSFMRALRQWSAQRLGMNEITWPYLSLYINGCRQGVHNDTKNGRFAFVYSLTRNDRKSTGGETIIFDEGDLFRRGLSKASAGSEFYTSVEPDFNRLVIFDDRIPHAVEQVDGPMDPLEGRFVMHGHLRNTGLEIKGALTAEIVAPAMLETILEFSSKAISRIRLYSGFLILRFVVSSKGTIERCNVLVDRVIAHDSTNIGWDSLAAEIVKRFKDLKFPTAGGPTEVTQPITFGGD